MGAVKDVLFDIEERLVDKIVANVIVDEAVMAELAKEMNVPEMWVVEAYENIKKDAYGDW